MQLHGGRHGGLFCGGKTHVWGRRSRPSAGVRGARTSVRVSGREGTTLAPTEMGATTWTVGGEGYEEHGVGRLPPDVSPEGAEKRPGAGGAGVTPRKEGGLWAAAGAGRE